MHSSIKSEEAKGVVKRTPLFYIGAGSQFSGMILAGFIVGYFFDSFGDTQPLFLIACGFMGILGGFMKLYRLFK